MFYIVVDVATDAIRYAGIREVLAAEALAPGCTFGDAETEGKALRLALERSAKARWAYGQLGLGPKQSFKPKMFLEPRRERRVRRGQGRGRMGI